MEKGVSVLFCLPIVYPEADLGPLPHLVHTQCTIYMYNIHIHMYIVYCILYYVYCTSIQISLLWYIHTLVLLCPVNHSVALKSFPYYITHNTQSALHYQPPLNCTGALRLVRLLHTSFILSYTVSYTCWSKHSFAPLHYAASNDLCTAVSLLSEY